MKLNFFSKRSVGLDIADHTIEMVELTKKGDTAFVSASSRVSVAPGILERGNIRDEAGFIKILEEVFAQAVPKKIDPKDVVVGVPESQLYSHVATLEVTDTHTLERSIVEEAHKHIPLETDDMALSSSVRLQKEGKAEVIIVATSKTFLNHWQRALKEAGVYASSFDPETLAVFRGLERKEKTLPVCVVDIGSVSTNIACFDSHGLLYSFTVPIGGEKVTKELSIARSSDETDAENEKKTIGLTAPGESTTASIIRTLEPIFAEVKRALTRTEDMISMPVSEIILVGGSSELPGLVEYVSANTDCAVSLGRTNVQFVTGEEAGIPRISPRLFLEAVGLAWRGLEDTWNEDPVFELS